MGITPSELRSFWGSVEERSGEYTCTADDDDSEIHLLLPRKQESLVNRWAQTKYVIVTTGPVPEKKSIPGVQFWFEDHSLEPRALMLSGTACKRLGDLAPDRDWRLSVWVFRNGQPHRAMNLPCICNRSDSLPDLNPIGALSGPALDIATLPLQAHVSAQLSLPKAVTSPTVVTDSQSHAAPTLRNILGLPRMLTRDRGKRLLELLELNRRETRKQFMREPHVVHWAHTHGLRGMQPTQEVICQLTADRRYRMGVFQVFFAMAEGARRARSNRRFSLELTILITHFVSALQKALDRQALQGTLASFDNAPELVQKMISAVEQTESGWRSLWMIWPSICSALVRWPQLSASQRELPVLGLFLLVTISCSLEPVKLAQLIVPELQEEFADMRPVYKRLGSRTRIPSASQKCRIDRRLRDQIRVVVSDLKHLSSIRATAEALEPLKRNIDWLGRISRARDRLSHALNAGVETPPF